MKTQMKAQSRAALAQQAQAKAPAKTPATNPNDPTPERLSHDPSAPVSPKWGSDETRTVLKVRQFKTTRVDQLYHLGVITWAHWYAANWWRSRVEEGLGLARVVADYGQSNGGGSRDPSPIPITDKAEAARKALTEAKAALSIPHRMAIEDALDDPHPALVGRSATARCDRWREGLQALAVYLKVAV
ncbi:MAG: hypothetical protein ACRYG4_17175 [Janthinobacterium lividum]